jgi:hypothetical protein
VTCIAEPISWLRLERRSLGELADPSIESHLAACAACRACADRIAAPGPVLRALPTAPPRRAWVLRFWWAGALASAAAVLVLLLLPRNPAPASTPRIRIKGGVDLVVTAVRERAGFLTHTPTTFAPGDRFKLMLTCSTPTPVLAEVVVFQHGAPSFPLSPARLTCGNDVVLPGAFSITSPAPALACVAIDTDRDTVTPHHPAVACLSLAPE